MQILVLTFTDPLNTSLQVGDVIYYSSTTTVPNSGFSTASATIIQLGIITSINNPLGLIGGDPINISVMFDDENEDGNSPPAEGDYIMFGKNKIVNNSNVTGYYLRADFKNYSMDEVKLFSVGSEFSESSK